MCLATAIREAVTSAILRPVVVNARRTARQRREGTTERRLAAGLCIRCGKAPHVPHNQRCEPCRLENIATVTAYVAKRKSARR